MTKPSSFVYCIAEEGSEFVKIGKAKNVNARRKELRTGSARPLTLAGQIPRGVAEEAALHWLFAPQHARGEWFRNDDGKITSWFADRATVIAKMEAAGLDTRPVLYFGGVVVIERAQGEADRAVIRAEREAHRAALAEKRREATRKTALDPDQGNTTTRGKVLALIHEARGTVRLEQRSLARTLGVAPSTVNRAIAALQADGAVKVRTSATGSVLALV
jgi:DNA-binding transcriptional regulator YiaG